MCWMENFHPTASVFAKPPQILYTYSTDKRFILILYYINVMHNNISVDLFLEFFVDTASVVGVEGQIVSINVGTPLTCW